MRSCRRLSCTSICDHAFLTRLRSWTSELYMPTKANTAMTMMPRNTSAAIPIWTPPYLPRRRLVAAEHRAQKYVNLVRFRKAREFDDGVELSAVQPCPVVLLAPVDQNLDVLAFARDACLFHLPVTDRAA